MSVETWDTDQAVTRGPWDEELEGCRSDARFGVTGWEEIGGEPLDVALAQEEADVIGFVGIDDQWVFVDDDEYDRFIAALSDDGPEGDAMHVVTP
jgi:hypothetical protein